MEPRTTEQITQPTALTIGKFESLHVGHQRLIQSVADMARGKNLNSAALTFVPNPIRVLGGSSYQTVFTLDEQQTIFKRLNKLDFLIPLTFDRAFADSSPETFAELLFGKLQCKVLVVGENFHFGRNRTGDAAFLRREGEKRNADVREIRMETANGEPISTTRVRAEISANNFRAALELLGFPFFCAGVVAHGDKIGRTIGFPTINVHVPDDKLLPQTGVYLTKTILPNGESFDSVTNAGVKRVGQAETRCVETFLFGFSGDLYGSSVEIQFREHIRGEQRFESPSALKNQISADVIAAKNMLETMDITP